MKLLILTIITSSIYAAPCSINYDNPTYTHGDISFDLRTPLKEVIEPKGYTEWSARSPFRASILVRIHMEEGTEVLRTYYNIYRYRSHLVHRYRMHQCNNTYCTREEVNTAVKEMILLADDLTEKCRY